MASWQLLGLVPRPAGLGCLFLIYSPSLENDAALQLILYAMYQVTFATLMVWDKPEPIPLVVPHLDYPFSHRWALWAV